MNSIIKWIEDEIKDVRKATSKLYAKASPDVDDEIPFLEGQDYAYNVVLQRLKIIGMGVLKSDDSGHWYLIPKEKAKYFYPMLELLGRGNKDDEKHYNEFIDAFEQYRLSGDLADLEIPMITGIVNG